MGSRAAGMRGAVLAALLLGTSPAPAQEAGAPADSLAGALDTALDRGDGVAVLDLVAGTTRRDPARAAATAGLATRLAPWMGGDIATTTLAALPEEARAGAAPSILLAVLSAARGRQAGRLTRAVAQAAPQADSTLLEGLARRFARAGRIDLLLAEMQAERASPPLLGAVTAGRAAVLDSTRAAAALDPARRPPPSPGVAPGPVSSWGWVEVPDHLEPRVYSAPPPRPPNPNDRPSPS